MKAKRNLWARKRNTFTIGIVVVMIIVLAVSFVSFFKIEETKEEEEYKPYESMYNASRYFFRVFYPDDWDVNADSYGFLMNEETGLVLELFPLKIISATASPVGTGNTPNLTSTPSPTLKATASASASIDPRAGMERNNDITISFYYKEYDAVLDEMKQSSESSGATATPDVTPSNTVSSPSAEVKEAPVELGDLAQHIFDKFKSEHEEGYTYSVLKSYEGATVNFYSMSYNYIKDDINMSGEIYVAARAMSYYIIHIDGTASAFRRYGDVIENIVYNIKFSVFDY